MNATELWQLSPEQFNEWRRANDYPLIWDLLVASLPHFDDWMTEQKIDKQVIFQIGIARFISSRCVLSLCLYMSDDKIRLYETASSALESLRKSGLIRAETRFEPYCMWLAGKHGKDEVKRGRACSRSPRTTRGRPRYWASTACSTSAAGVPEERRTSSICCWAESGSDTDTKRGSSEPLCISRGEKVELYVFYSVYVSLPPVLRAEKSLI